MRRARWEAGNRNALGKNHGEPIDQGRLTDMDPRAASLLPQCRQLIGDCDHHYVACDARNQYPGQDHRWYHTEQSNFEKAGCRVLGDMHETGSTETSSDSMRCFVRVLASPDGIAGVAAYRLHPPLWQKVLLFLVTWKRSVRKVRECETIFTDGTAVTTTNIRPSMLLDTPPLLSRRFLPEKIPAADLLEEHRRHVEEWRRGGSESREPIPLHSLEDYIRHSEVSAAQVRQYRRSYGGLTVPEISRFAGCDEAEAQVIQRDIIAALQAG